MIHVDCGQKRAPLSMSPRFLPFSDGLAFFNTDFAGMLETKYEFLGMQLPWPPEAVNRKSSFSPDHFVNTTALFTSGLAHALTGRHAEC